MMEGHLSHLDLCVSDPRKSISFYGVLLTSLGYVRQCASQEDRREPDPIRAGWTLRYADGTAFGIDLRSATSNSGRRYDPDEPGPHHLALQADSDAAVDRVHRAMQGIGATVADGPADFGGRPGYGDHYYAVFFVDPDGFKVEVVHAIGFSG